MTTKQATVKVRAVKIEPVDPTRRPFLIVDLAIDCPDCGSYTGRFAGHHLRAIRDALIGIIDEFPEVTGSDEQVEVIEQGRWQGLPSKDPRAN